LNTDSIKAVKVVDLEIAKKNFKVTEQDIMREIDLLKELNSP